MLIRRGGLADLDDLAPVFDAYREEPTEAAAARAFLDERIRRDESIIFLAVAEERSRVVLGFTQLYPSFSSVSLKRLWVLNDLFVRPDARRQGVARGLLERARQWAVETRSKGLILSTATTNGPAQSLYKSCGWRRDDESHHYVLLV